MRGHDRGTFAVGTLRGMHRNGVPRAGPSTAITASAPGDDAVRSDGAGVLAGRAGGQLALRLHADLRRQGDKGAWSITKQCVKTSHVLPAQRSRQRPQHGAEDVLPTVTDQVHTASPPLPVALQGPRGALTPQAPCLLASLPPCLPAPGPHLDQVCGAGHADAQRARGEAGRHLEVQRGVALEVLAHVQVADLCAMGQGGVSVVTVLGAALT